MSAQLIDPLGNGALSRVKQGIVWIASYPKSGNTWLRIFLRNLFNAPDEPSVLKGVGSSIASCRTLFDNISGIDSSDLTHEEIDQLRPAVYQSLVARTDTWPLFMKTHDAYSWLSNGEPLHSRSATAGAIYILRNPLDVAVSYAYHSGHANFAKMVDQLGDTARSLFSDYGRIDNQLRQKLLTWSGHISSWVDQTETPVHWMRYEDMQSNSLETFRAVVRFIGLEYGDDEIELALEKCRFEKLKELEQLQGFDERASQAKVFFREGGIGGWRKKLGADLVDQVVQQHREMMLRFGYLSSAGNLLA